MKLRNFSTILALLLALTAFGCEEEEANNVVKQRHDYTLEVDVKDSQGNVLSKVPVTVDDKVVGFTDADGKFTATLNEFAEKDLTLGVVAPDGYYFPEGTEKVTEKLRTTTVNKQESGVPIFLSAVAESLEKDYFFWVKTDCNDDCGDWPILVDGEEVARTNSLGYAHFSITDQPQAELTITIDSSGNFKPVDPEYAVSLDLDSTVYRIDQPFIDPSKKKKKRRPVRRRGKKKKKDDEAKKADVPDPDAFVEPKKPKKDDGVIDLFGP